MNKKVIILVLLLCSCGLGIVSAFVWPGWELEMIETNESADEDTDTGADKDPDTGTDEDIEADEDPDTDADEDTGADEDAGGSNLYTKHLNKRITGHQGNVDNVNNAYRNTNTSDIFSPAFNSLTNDEKNSQLLEYRKEKCNSVPICKGFNLNRNNKTCWFKSTNNTDLLDNDENFIPKKYKTSRLN
jgi:hypothetical protein